MNVEISETAGFCMGVSKAVSLVEDLIKNGKKVCTLGPIIHNPKVIEKFANQGVRIIERASENSADSVVVIRSHGISKTEFDYIKGQKINCVDGTCPFVKKIHDIVSRRSKTTKFLIIAGDSGHPEVIGIKSYFLGESFVFKDINELRKIILSNIELKNSSVLVISQTTYNIEEWVKCAEFIKQELPSAVICNTICNTTNLRQQEAKALSKKSDLMIVIGGKQSSNTLKLYNICSENAPTVWIEDANELESINLKKYENIGIVAGASTPKSDINEAYKKICAL